MRRELIFVSEMLPIVQITLLILTSIFQLIYMIKFLPFEKNDLNYMEIFNTSLLYSFSVMMLLKMNNPYDQNESGFYLTP